MLPRGTGRFCQGGFGGMGRNFRTEKAARIRQELRVRAAVERRGYVTSAEVADVAALYEVGPDYVQQLGRLLRIGVDQPQHVRAVMRDAADPAAPKT